MKITIDSHTPSNTGVNTQHPALHNSLVQYVWGPTDHIKCHPLIA